MAESLVDINSEKWVENFGDEFFRYAMSKTGKKEISEDLVQETFLAALKAKDKFNGESSERTWLYSILKFKIADYYRKASTKYEINDSKISAKDKSFFSNYFSPDGEWLDTSQPKIWPANLSIETKELAEALDNCFEKLPAIQRQIITAKLIEDKSAKIICKEHQISTTNYWVIIHRAKLQLRACLEKNWLQL